MNENYEMCRATTKKGAPCKNTATWGFYCTTHKHLRFEETAVVEIRVDTSKVKKAIEGVSEAMGRIGEAQRRSGLANAELSAEIRRSYEHDAEVLEQHFHRPAMGRRLKRRTKP